MIGKRMRAERTKRKLFELTEKATASGNGTSSYEIVAEIRKNFGDVIKHDIDDIVEVGLLVLAGRVAVSSRSNDTGPDLLSESGYPSFITIRTKIGNNIVGKRYDTRLLTPKMFFSESNVERKVPERKPVKSKNKRTQDTMLEMKENGKLSMTLLEWLNRSR